MTKLANLGYLIIGKEATKGTAVTPDVTVPLYSESLATNLNLDEDNPIVGQRFGKYQILKGQRDHQGALSILAEPKTLPNFLRMILTAGSPSGSGVVTHPFTLGSSVNAYTLDILKGDIVHRFYGVEVRSITPEFEDNKMKLALNVSALGSVCIMPISSASGTTVTLATDYDEEPAEGLTTSDSITLVKVTGGTIDSTEDADISSINAAKTIITVDSALGETYSAGDYCYIKAQTPSVSIGTPFTWARTEFCFGDTAAAALTATQSKVEKGSAWDLTHDFESDEGAKRSGSYDPAALVRAQANAEVNIKRFLDDGRQLQKWIRRTKVALVVRHYGALISGSDYNELRLTFNDLKITESPDPLSSGEIIYINQIMKAAYDSGDAQGLDLKVINDIASY